MKKCSNCGKEVEENAKYCSECGNSLLEKTIGSPKVNITKKRKGNASGIIIVLLTIFFLFATIGTFIFGTIYLFRKLDIGNMPNRMVDNMMDTNNQGVIVLSSSYDWIYLTKADLYSGSEETMEVDLDNDGTKEIFALRKDDSGVLVNLYSVSSNKAINVFKDNINTESSLNETGELADIYGIQVTTRDLDSDGIQEVLVAVGNSIDDMKLTIYGYEKGIFTNKGNLDGEDIISIGSFGNIRVHSNVSSKLQGVYRYENGEIVKISKDNLIPKLKNSTSNKIVNKLESDGNSEVKLLGGEREISFVMNKSALKYVKENGTVSEDFIKYCKNTAKENNIEYMEILMKDANGNYELALEIENNNVIYVYEGDTLDI